MIGLLRKLFHRPAPLALGLAAKPVSDKTRVWEALTGPGAHCPDCGGREFFLGPHGGACQNIACANPACGSRFNLAPFDDEWCGVPIIAERIPKY